MSDLPDCPGVFAGPPPVDPEVLDEACEAVGLAMEDWACRMHGILASSHRPGRDDNGHEEPGVETERVEDENCG